MSQNSKLNDAKHGQFVTMKQFEKVNKDNNDLKNEIENLKANIIKHKREKKAFISDIAVMKSTLTEPDKTEEHDGKINLIKQDVKRSQKELLKSDNELNVERTSFDSNSIALNKIYKQIKSQLKKTNTFEGK